MFRKIIVSILAVFGASYSLSSNIDFDTPLVEYPDGIIRSSKDAIAEVFKKLEGLGEVDRWLGIFAQGNGHATFELHVKLPYLKLVEDVPNIDSLLSNYGVLIDKERTDENQIAYINISKLSPEKQALLVNDLFKNHYKVEPFEGEADFALGAEWL
ncbi:MAG: hypothetical protein HWE27_14025 [Gammaproteobacteria bacterium]|nr:hypothetical protein [Gammaproteobacteria bacterium]